MSATLLRPGRRRWALVLVALVLVGGGLRAAQAADPGRRQSADETGYVKAATLFAETGNYPRRSVHWPPGAPMMFALAHAIGGGEVDEAGRRDIPLAYWFQWFVSTATIVVVFAAAALLAGGAAGALAATVVALYPPLVAGPADLLSEPLGTFLLAASVLLVVVALRRRARRVPLLALAGFVLGLAVLTRANLLVAPLAAAAVLLVAGARRAGLRAAIVPALALLAGALVPVGGWSAFVSLENDVLVPVTTGGGVTLFIGTYLPGDGRLDRAKVVLAPEIHRRFPWTRRYAPRDIPGKVAMDAVAARRGRGRGERDELLRAEGMDNLRRYARESPVEYAAFFLNKLPYLWLRPSQALRQPALGLWIAHVVLVLAAAAGLLLGLVRTRDTALAIVLAILASVTLVHVITAPGPRYALPLLPILWIAGAAGLVLARRGRAVCVATRSDT